MEVCFAPWSVLSRRCFSSIRQTSATKRRKRKPYLNVNTGGLNCLVTTTQVLSNPHTHLWHDTKGRSCLKASHDNPIFNVSLHTNKQIKKIKKPRWKTHEGYSAGAGGNSTRHLPSLPADSPHYSVSWKSTVFAFVVEQQLSWALWVSSRLPTLHKHPNWREGKTGQGREGWCTSCSWWAEATVAPGNSIDKTGKRSHSCPEIHYVTQVEEKPVRKPVPTKIPVCNNWYFIIIILFATTSILGKKKNFLVPDVNVHVHLLVFSRNNLVQRM